MRSLWLKSCFFAALATGAGTSYAGVGRLADVEIYDRANGHMLPIHWHRGQAYVAGQPGHEYEIRLRSRDDGRLLAVASVDGVNVITGETASVGQSGYVLDRYDALTISGWRKNLSRTAAFYFTALSDSYAARTGRPNDVGVIGVALFREAPRYRYDESEIAREAPAAPVGDAAQAEQRSTPAPSSSRDERYAYRSGALGRTPEKLGTGHGRSEWSSARYTQFERASSAPDEIVKIYYDSRANLIAQGIIAVPPVVPHRPRAFPAGFVPDP